MGDISIPLGRPGLAPFNPSQWLVIWPCAFRMEILRYIRILVLDNGLKTENSTATRAPPERKNRRYGIAA